MSLTVVITPFTVTVATAALEEDQLKFPLPPIACHKQHRTGATERHVNTSQSVSGVMASCPEQLRPESKAGVLRRSRYLYRVLIDSNHGLPWECENAWTQNNRVVDFYVLLIVDGAAECMDLPGLKGKETRGGDKGLSPAAKHSSRMILVKAAAATRTQRGHS